MPNKHTAKEVKQVAKELRKLTKVIAVIGKTMIDEKIKDIENKNEEFKELVKKEKEKHNSSKWRLKNCT